MGYPNSKSNPNDRDYYATPEYIKNYALWRWQIDIDLAGDEENCICSPVLTEKMDSLSQDWISNGHTGWCNPPYSNITPWIEKAIQEAERGFTTIMFIPQPNGDSRDELIFKHASQIIYVIGRVGFVLNGVTHTGNNRGSMFVVFKGKRYVQFYREDLKISYVWRKEIQQMEKDRFFEDIPF